LRARSRWGLGLAGILLASLYAPTCLRILTPQDLGPLSELPVPMEANTAVQPSFGQSQLVP